MPASPRRLALMEQLLGDLTPLLAAYPLPELRGKRLFITGATGFIGYWLLLAIHSMNQSGAGIRVHALSRDPQTFLARRPECEGMNWLNWVRGDVRDYRFPNERFDAILHGAADTSPEAAARAEELRKTIVAGARRTLVHGRTCGARRILLVSSGAVYGEQPDAVERLEESATFATTAHGRLDGYLEGKRAMEDLALARPSDLEPVVARCFAFVGYGLPPHLAISQFIRDAKENPEIAVNGDGRPVRSFLYAADLAVWLLALLSRGRPGQTYNVGSSHGMSLADAAIIVRDTLAPEKPLAIRGTTSNRARRRYVPDVRKAERELGVRVWTQFPEAIRRTARTSD
jgi:nucleoside-diphosphate-sugar epimerase